MLAVEVVDLAGATAGRKGDGKSLVPLFLQATAHGEPRCSWRERMVLPQHEGVVYGYYSGVRTAAYKYREQVNNNERRARN